MRRWLTLFSVVVVACASAVEADVETVHESRWAEVDLRAALPADLLAPEGKTRWDVTSLELLDGWTRSIRRSEPAVGLRLLQAPTPGSLFTRPDALFRDPTGSGGAERWLLPQHDSALLAVGPLQPIELEVVGDAAADRLWIQVERVGLGWLHGPFRPREVVLQRALVLKRPDGSRSWEPHSLIHRWIDPRDGVVAEIEGRASADGRRRLDVTRAAVAEQVTRGGTPFKLYIDDVDRPIGSLVRFGYDQERRCTEGGNLCRTTSECAGGTDTCAEIPVSVLTSPSYATIGELTCDPDGMGVCQVASWDFSGNNPTSFPGMERLASTSALIAAEQTSAFGECGFTDPGGTRKLSTESKNFDQPNIGNNDGDLNITASVSERTGGVTSVGNIWLRAGIVNEGVGGSGFTAESRTCHDPTTGRTEVPLWRFANDDGSGWYFTEGDTWANDTVFDCEQTIFAETVIFQDLLWIAACTGTPIGDLAGEQRSTVINAGPVTLPSGHTFNAALVRNLVEYCAYASFIGPPSCSGDGLNQVRVVLHLWEVPLLGTVARLMSNTEAPSVTGLTTLDETDIKYGLFPPRAISVDGTGADSVDLSWDPGLIDDHIDDYKIYWDTVSGAGTGGSYGFNSDDNAGQVTFTGATSATIGGLTGGQPYFFTVTSRTDYCAPNVCGNNDCAPSCPSPGSGCPALVCNDSKVFESLMFPMQVADGGGMIPAEVSATPGAACTPTVEVGGLTVDRDPAGIEICWNPVADPCVDGYRILGASDPSAAANFSPLVGDTGLVTCATLDPAEGFFLVIGKGSGGTGPWGHFGQ